jgi:hypothetical protein
MRLHGRRLEAVDGKPIEVEVQRFYGGCSVAGGDHPFEGDVCSTCCPTKCLEKLGCNCQAPIVSSGAALMSNDCPVHGLIGFDKAEGELLATGADVGGNEVQS